MYKRWPHTSMIFFYLTNFFPWFWLYYMLCPKKIQIVRTLLNVVFASIYNITFNSQTEGVGWTAAFKASILPVCLWAPLRMNYSRWVQSFRSQEQRAKDVHQAQLFPSCPQDCGSASNGFSVCSWNPIVRTPGVSPHLRPISWGIAGHPWLLPPSLFWAADAPWLDLQLLKQDLGVRSLKFITLLE